MPITRARANQPVTCVVCYKPQVPGSDHERCRTLGYNRRQYLYRQTDEEKSEVSTSTNSSSLSDLSANSDGAVHWYASPPPSPTRSVASSRTSGASEKSVRRQLAPPPPYYPPSVISEASFVIPETGPFHHVNRRFQMAEYAPPPPHCTAPTAPTEVGSDVSTETASSVPSGYMSNENPNLRQPSPGPSAICFLREERGPPGAEVRINDDAASDATERPVSFNKHFVGGDENIRPFCAASEAGVVKFDYWPEKEPELPPRKTKSECVEIAFEPTERVIDSFVKTSVYIRFMKPFVDKIPVFLACLFACLLGGYICKYYM